MCIKRKGRTSNALYFKANLERNLRQLCNEVNARTYEIGKSIAFIVEQPVKREVFAADFRDRVVHDWVCMKLNPLFEQYIPENICSNRVNKGTLYAIKRVYSSIERVSEGYTKDCWIWKFDLKGFFMSIDKRILNAKLQAFIDEHYFEYDKDTLKWLVEKIIMHCPQKNCIRKSKPSAWRNLRSEKSLFTQDDYHGVPIGNLPSQLFANFLLSDLIFYLQENGFNECTQYVDDDVVVFTDKRKLLEFIPIFRTWLLENLGITLHPKKCYIQHYTKGVSFVGGLIKPHRMYISKRTRRKMKAKIHWIVYNNGGSLKDALASVNSYFGQTRQFYGYKLRLVATSELFKRFHKDIYFNNNCQKMIIVKRLKTRRHGHI